MKKLFCLNPDTYRQQVKANLIAFIEALPADKSWAVEIEPLRKERTLKQNAALFGVAYKELEAQTGNDKNDLHEFFCMEFFGRTEKVIFGHVKIVPVRTTTTDENGKHDVVPTEVFAQFYDFIQRKSAENGFHVSDPDPLWSLKKYENSRNP